MQPSLWVGVGLCLLQLCVRGILPASVPQVQLHELKISEHNDTEYVRRVMRLAKSAEMRNYMLPTVDACDNFFQYACGSWPKINPTDVMNMRETNFFVLLTNTYNQKQLRVLQEEPQASDSQSVLKVKHFFGACRRLSRKHKKRYKLKLWEIVAEFGEMPALVSEGSWQEGEFDWLTTIARIQNKYGLDIILQLGKRQDFNNKTVSKLFIGQPKLKLETKAMYKSEATKWHRDAYRLEIQKNLEQYMGVKEEIALSTATQILDFETKLAEGTMDKRLGKTLKSMTRLRTVEEMQAAYDGVIDIRKFLTIALGHELNTTFYEYYLDYQKNLMLLLKVTPKEQLANYIFYQLLQVFFFNYEETNLVRDKLCLAKTKLFFAKMLDNIIFHKYNNEGTVRDINLIWAKIKEIFKEELESEQLNWISPITRQGALEKLEAMRLEINSYENAKFDEEFSNLSISATDYIENVKKVLVFETQRALANLYEAPKPVELPLMFSYTAAYIASENLIKVPVMLLQPNFLWSDFYPNALKFGTLGYLVGHELIHGFDDMGRNFDPAGDEQSWWDSNSTLAFNERKQCFKRQYAHYRYGGKYLPESELQAENIADNGGIQLAYSAYLKWLAGVEHSDQGTEERKRLLEAERLPNMDYSNKQLFFLGFAQYWCNDVNEHFKDKVSLVSLHAPAMYRVIGSLANFDEFSKEFQCARGTTMNPERKCRIY